MSIKKSFIMGQSDSGNNTSLASKLRAKRMEMFFSMLDTVKKDRISILDIGGTASFWENKDIKERCRKKGVLVTVLNLEKQDARPDFIQVCVRDARDLSLFKDKEFDVVFSNSLIEHLATFHEQEKLACEIRRIGESYFIQTPNYYFPLEPHTLFPFFQFMPLRLKVWLLTHFDLGWYGKVDGSGKALEIASEIRLLTGREMKGLFHDGKIYREKFLGLTKSFIAYRFEQPLPRR